MVAFLSDGVICIGHIGEQKKPNSMKNSAFQAIAQMCVKRLFCALLASSFLCARLGGCGDGGVALVIVSLADKASQ